MFMNTNEFSTKAFEDRKALIYQLRDEEKKRGVNSREGESHRRQLRIPRELGRIQDLSSNYYLDLLVTNM